MRIFQGYFDEASKRHVDPAAEPMDISFNLNHPLYEYNIFRTMMEKGLMDSGEPVGLLSWKFRIKTLVDIDVFSDFCRQAFEAGADVAFINPMIAAEAMYKNVWEQGEHVGHTGMVAIAGALFSSQQIAQINLMPKMAFAFCNYFVGNHRFWSEYIAFCEKILARIEALKETNPQAYKLIHGSAHYHRNVAADFRPFLLERIFSSFLMLRPDIKRASFDYASEVYEKKFGENNGKYLYALSGLKNNGIHSGNPEWLKKWDEARRPVLNAPVETWLKDDPQPT